MAATGNSLSCGPPWLVAVLVDGTSAGRPQPITRRSVKQINVFIRTSFGIVVGGFNIQEPCHAKRQRFGGNAEIN
jgi:hypothetical protein